MNGYCQRCGSWEHPDSMVNGQHKSISNCLEATVIDRHKLQVKLTLRQTTIPNDITAFFEMWLTNNESDRTFWENMTHYFLTDGEFEGQNREQLLVDCLEEVFVKDIPSRNTIWGSILLRSLRSVDWVYLAKMLIATHSKAQTG